MQDVYLISIQKVIVRFFFFFLIHDNLIRAVFDNTFAGLFSPALVYSPVVAESLLRKATTIHDRASRLLRLNAHVAITGNAVTGSDFTLRSIDFVELDFRFGFPSTDRRIDMLSVKTTSIPDY